MAAEGESRNSSKGQAYRQWTNFLVLKESHKRYPDRVHVVWALVSSLLGLVVIPVERRAGGHPDKWVPLLDDLAKEGWPTWKADPGGDADSPEYLGQLLRHIRNAVAHAGLRFNTDARELKDTTLYVEDYSTSEDTGEVVRWRAQIECSDLETFCEKLAGYYKLAPPSPEPPDLSAPGC